MSHNWKPGDMAIVANEVAMFVDQDGDRFWITPIGTHWRVYDAPQRPLAVIDFEDREQVERLHALYEDLSRGVSADDMQAALREFASPTPPRPEEPQGLGAVVEAIYDNRFVRIGDGTWQRVEKGRKQGAVCAYDEIAAVRILSEGVAP